QILMGHAVQGEAAKDQIKPGLLAAAQRVVRGMLLLGTGLALSACTVGPDFVIPPAPQIALTPKPLKAPGSAGGDAQRFLNGLDSPGAWLEWFRSRGISDFWQPG